MSGLVILITVLLIMCIYLFAKLFWFVTKGVLKIIIIVAIIGAVMSLSCSAFAWGPYDREVFTMENPSTYVTLNSITDNGNYGDERNFVLVKDASNQGAGGFCWGPSGQLWIIIGILALVL